MPHFGFVIVIAGKTIAYAVTNTTSAAANANVRLRILLSEVLRIHPTLLRRNRLGFFSFFLPVLLMLPCFIHTPPPERNRPVSLVDLSHPIERPDAEYNFSDNLLLRHAAHYAASAVYRRIAVIAENKYLARGYLVRQLQIAFTE